MDRVSSFLVAVCFTLNYIIGTGFLTLPWAFNKTGHLLGFLVLFVLTMFSSLSVVFLLESMARTAKLMELDDASSNHNIREETRFHQTGAGYGVISTTSEHAQDSHSTFEIEKIENDDRLIVKTIKYDITDMCALFLGRWGTLAYAFFISVYMYSTLWVYTTVFAMAFASRIDFGPHSYSIFVLIFSLFVVPISLMELKEQVYLQVILSACRIFMVLAMIVTILYAETHPSAKIFTDTINVHSDSEKDWFTLAELWNVYLLLPKAAYANIFHHSIPALAELVEDKSLLNHVFFTALIVAMISYAGIGTVISGYFGSQTNISSNLNWATFQGVLNGDGTEKWSARFLAAFVVLFPAFDVASAFPLNAITLANSLMSAHDGDRVHELSKSKLHRYYFRLIAVIPPLIAAFFISKLGEVTDFAGLTGFVIAFVIPALLARYSSQALQDKGVDPWTVYGFQTVGSGAQIATSLLGVGLVVFVGYCLIVIGSF